MPLDYQAEQYLAALQPPNRLEIVDGEPDPLFSRKAGQVCVYVNNASLYFLAGDDDDTGDADGAGWRDSATPINVKVAVEYFDKGTETIRIGYTPDGTSETLATIVTKTNTKTWKKATLKINGVLLGTDFYGIDDNETVGGGGDHYNADFRIFSSGDLYLGSLALTNRTTKAAIRFPAYEYLNQTSIVPPGGLPGTGDEFDDELLAGWTVTPNEFSADSGNFRIRSNVPALTLGAATDFLTGEGFFVGKSGGYYSQHIGNPAGQYMSFNGATGQLYVSGTIAGTIVSGGTDSNSWTINQDLTDTNVDLVFGRTTGGNATLRWNGSVINALNTLQENGVTVAKQNRAINTTGALAGGGDLSADRTLSLNTPGTLTVSTSNSAATNHTHALTSSSNPGAAASLLATDASGFLNLVKLNVDTLADKSGGNLTIAPTGDVVFNPTGKDLLPNANYDLNVGALSKKYLTLHAAELWVETLVAQNTLATIGGRILVLPTNLLIADCAPAATTIDVKYNNLASGDRIYLEANAQVEFMAVTSGATGISGGYRYSVTRNLDASGANQWYAGDAVANTGQTGSGFIDLYSVRGVKASSEVGPTIVGNVRNSATYNDWSTTWAVGNLNGLYGYGANTPGAAFGKYASGQPNITVDTTNGIRIRNYTTTLAQWDTSGNITIGEVAASKANTLISAGALALRVNTTQYFGIDTSGNVTFGNVATNQGNVYWNNSNKRLEFRGSTGGTVVQAYVDTNGAITFGAGNGTLDANGLRFVQGSSGTNSVEWYSGANVVGRAYAVDDGSSFNTLYLSGRGVTGTRNGRIYCTVTDSAGATTGLFVVSDNSVQLSNANLVWTTDNAYDLGYYASTAYRPRNAYIAEKIFLNETANANAATASITIHQGGNNDEAFAIKRTSVAHGMTSLTETDTYGTITPFQTTNGALGISGYSASTIGINLGGYYTTGNTSRSTSAVGGVVVDAYKKSGGSKTTPAANENLFVVRSNTAAKFLVDAEGDIHMDATSNINAWDDHDDVALLEAFRIKTAGVNFKKQFARDIEAHARTLHETGVLTLNEDGHHFVSVKGLFGLTIDAVRQLAWKMERYERALLALGVNVNQIPA